MLGLMIRKRGLVTIWWSREQARAVRRVKKYEISLKRFVVVNGAQQATERGQDWVY